MSGFSNYLSQAILQHTLIAHDFPSVFTPHIALFFADPTDGTTLGTELPAAGWYARQTTGSWSTLPDLVTIIIHNTTQIQWSAVSFLAGTTRVTHWGIFDSLTSGNMLYSDSIGTARDFAVGDVPVIAGGALIIGAD